MRLAGVIAILLIILILTAGCGQRVPTRNTTTKNPWGNATVTPKGGGGSSSGTTVVPTTTSPLIQATLMATPTTTPISGTSYRGPPPEDNATANLTLFDEQKMGPSYIGTAYNLNLTNTPLLIDLTMTVPNITRTVAEKDPTVVPSENDPNPTRTATKTYPDPTAWFEVTVMDLKTKHIIARGGYGRTYDVSTHKQVWVRYPGSYHIEFTGARLTADVHFWMPNQTAGGGV
ncbi:MAG: hypothetical protein ACM3X8_02960 [Methanomicrobiales archaeon]